MNNFPQAADVVQSILEMASFNPSTMTIDQLERISTNMKVSAAAQCITLLGICGGDQEAAKREIRLAADLPASVRRRRYDEANEVVEAGGIPTAPQLAAFFALNNATIGEIDAEIARRRGLN